MGRIAAEKKVVDAARKAARDAERKRQFEARLAWEASPAGQAAGRRYLREMGRLLDSLRINRP